jgi:hypothetical protein
MTQLDPSGWVSPLIGPLTIQVNGVEIAVYRGTWNFTGASVTDDAVNARLDFALGSSFGSGIFKIANPLGTFYYTFAGSAILADRTVTFPLLTGNDSFVFEAHTQTLTNKTLTAPTIGGTAVYTGTDANDTSLSLCPIKIRKAQVQTTDATVTTLLSYTMTDETLCAFDVVVTVARRTNVTKGGRYKRSVVYRRTSAGVATIVGTLETGTDQETTAGLDVTIDTDGANAVRVRVTGEAATNYNWACEMRIEETLAT